MSFNFQWPVFSRDFHADAAKMLDSALNRGPKPKVIADDIKVEDINMGTVPPELEMLEIGELSTDRFRGIFRLTYTGDAHLILSTKVQANPLTRPSQVSPDLAFEDASSVFPSSMPSRGILFAARPLVVPMQLRLSAVRLKAIVVLVVSKQKGITLVFKNDPLESVDVSSTFDSVAVIQKYLQQEIEGQLREMFREDLPGIIHRLSQRWLSGKQDKQAAVPISRPGPTRAATSPPAASARPILSPSKSIGVGGGSNHTPSSPPERRRSRQRQSSSASSLTQSPSQRRLGKSPKGPPSSSPRTTHRGSMVTSTSSPHAASRKATTSQAHSTSATYLASPIDTSSSPGLNRSWGSDLMDEMEKYDPTYGLRPDEIRMSIHGTGFSGLAKLASRVNGGLRDLAEVTPEAHEANHPASVGARRAQEKQEDEDERSGVYDEAKNSLRGRSDEEDVSSADELSSDVQGDDVPDFPLSDDEDEDEADPASSPSRRSSEDLDIDDPINDVFNPFAETSASARFALDRSPRSGSQSARSLPRRKGVDTESNASVARRARKGSKVEYETIPAVGGGIITRPRIYHMASQVRAPEVEKEDELGEEDVLAGTTASSTIRGPSSSRAQTLRSARSHAGASGMRGDRSEDEGEQSETGGATSALGEDSLTTLEPEPMDPRTSSYRTQLYRQQYGRLYRAGYERQSSLSSSHASGQASGSSSRQDLLRNTDARSATASRSSTAPTSLHPSTSNDMPLRRTHASQSDGRRSANTKSSPPTVATLSSPSPLRPSSAANGHSMTLGASHHFMDLVNSNHTLSPFTRTLDTKGYAVRSHPVTPSTGSGGETSSSAGGAGLPRASHARSASSLRRTLSSTGASTAGYFERPKTISEHPAAGKRRVFRLGKESKDGTSAQESPSKARPGSTPIQQAAPRALSSSGVQDRPRASPSLRSGDDGLAAPLRQGRTRAYGSERGLTMGAIRE